jgi:hypothetical protein
MPKEDYVLRFFKNIVKDINARIAIYQELLDNKDQDEDIKRKEKELEAAQNEIKDLKMTITRLSLGANVPLEYRKLL